MFSPARGAAWAIQRGLHDPTFRDFVDQIVKQAVQVPDELALLRLIAERI
jgi:hypothetical protein